MGEGPVALIVSGGLVHDESWRGGRREPQPVGGDHANPQARAGFVEREVECRPCLPQVGGGDLEVIASVLDEDGVCESVVVGVGRAPPQHERLAVYDLVWFRRGR